MFPGRDMVFRPRGWSSASGENARGFPSTAGIDVRVSLRRRDAGMAEHLLDMAEIDPSGHEMRGEAVAEGVGADVGGHAGLPGVIR
jgi:hypothetical protein